MTVPERLEWAVARLAPAPADRVLEIGCGPGVAVSLVCARLTTGVVTALDRSGTAVEAARRRNSESVAAGRAVLLTTSLEEADFPAASFDKVLAVNVNLFWVRSPDEELKALGRWLAPGGTLCLCWEPPDARRAGEIGRTVAAACAAVGFSPEVHTAVTAKGGGLVCVRATRPPSAGEGDLGGAGQP